MLFLPRETAGKCVYNVLDVVFVAARARQSTRLLRNVKHRRASLTGYGLRSLTILKRLHEDDVRRRGLHFANYLRKMRGGRRDTRLWIELVHDLQTKAVSEITEVLVIGHDLRTAIRRELFLPASQVRIDLRVELRKVRLICGCIF